ncbi:MAG: amino acid permease, partial [Myxococcota bacterium]
LWAARGALTQLPDRAVDVLVPATQPEWAGVLLGSFIAFYAFIGFEDMVNTAEEVVRPQRTLPLAITLALGLSLVLYTLVAAACVLSLPSEVLAASDAPLADVVRAHTGTDPVVLGWISLVAVVNGALVQLVMASRVLYGLAREGWLPASLARVHPTRETPIRATAWVVGAVAVLALTSPVETLAEITSVLLLCVFALVNVALFVVKGTAPDSPFRLPRALPLVGASVILAFLAFRLYEAII